jgi:hypothetical protein
MATELADGGKIAVIDTERSSASLYADKFEFDTLSMAPPYHPDRLIEALKSAEEGGYACVVIDSLTHFWSGKGGVLEVVDEAKSRFNGNTHSAWQVGTPLQQAMIDAMLSFSGHIMVTMRSKTEWSIEKDERGKTKIAKVGLAPQQRDGIEYEFTLVFDIDQQHRASVSKTRCDALSDRTFTPANAQEAMDVFSTWLQSGDPTISKNERDSIENRISGLNPNTRRALGEAWAKAGFPKVAQMPATRVAEVHELIATFENAVEEPETAEVVPE